MVKKHPMFGLTRMNFDGFDLEKRADSNKASAMKLFALRRVLNQAAHKIKRLSLPS